MSVLKWLTTRRLDVPTAGPGPAQPRAAAGPAAAIRELLSSVRRDLQERVRDVNQMTEREVLAAAHHVDAIVERAREYIRANQEALSALGGGDKLGVARLISEQSDFLQSFAREMAQRAAIQDEHARRAAQHAARIGDLASGIEQLAGDARMLAINARIESARRGVGRSGFDVLAAEMRRLSDAVAASNDRVRELASLLASDLEAITRHSSDLRNDTQAFSTEAVGRIDQTQAQVKELRQRLADLSRAGEAGMQDVLRSSQEALSHLQFQDVTAQSLRSMDRQLRAAQVECVRMLSEDEADVAPIAPAEYETQGGDGAEGAIAEPGEVTFFQ